MPLHREHFHIYLFNSHSNLQNSKFYLNFSILTGNILYVKVINQYKVFPYI